MFCTNCGNRLPDHAKFCTGCGTKVSDPAGKTEESRPDSTYRYVPPRGSAREVIDTSARRQENRNAGKAAEAEPKAAVSSAPKAETGKASAPSKSTNLSGVLGLLLILAFVAIAAASVVLNMSIPEFFGVLRRGEPLLDRGLYDLKLALAEQDTTVTIREDNWDTSVCPWSQIEPFLRDYIIANPELYYVDIRNTKIVLVESADDSYCALNIAYFDDLTSERAAQQLEAAADSILKSIPSGSSDWEKALYLHDELICHVTYESGTRDQTAYGALVDGKAVCMGYAMAYEYLLTRAGVECDTVIGYADEFSAALDGTLFQQDQHAWTIVTFRENGVEQSYYVDTTWDDTDMTDAYGREYISRRWFCVTQEDISREGRSVLQDGYDMSQWNLNDDAMNYYDRTGAMIDSYDFSEVVQIMQAQIQQGNNRLSLRVTDLDAYYDLLFSMEEGGDFRKLCDALDISSCGYEFSYRYTGDGLLCFDIYLNYPG